MTKNKHEELRIMPLPKKVIFSFAITEPVIIYIWCIAYRNIRLIRVYMYNEGGYIYVLQGPQ